MNPFPENIAAHLASLEGEAGFAARLLNGLTWIYHERVFLAASTIKIPILAAYFAALEAGTIPTDALHRLQACDRVADSPALVTLPDGAALPLQEAARWMMVVSDNTATNILIERLTIPGIQAWIDAQGFMPRTRLQRRMMDQEARRAGRDNWTTPLEMLLLMERLARRELVSPAASDQMLAILYQQQDREKIPALLIPLVKVANKPGELPGNRSDVGYLTDGRRQLVLSIFCDQLAHEAETDLWMAQLAQMCWASLTSLD